MDGFKREVCFQYCEMLLWMHVRRGSDAWWVRWTLDLEVDAGLGVREDVGLEGRVDLGLEGRADAGLEGRADAGWLAG